MNKFLKALSFGLIMSGVALSQENTSKHDVFKANNSLPPTMDNVFKANNSLPPTMDNVFKANNSLPPTMDNVFKANNSLPPTWDGPFKANNSLPPTPENTLPPTWDLCATVKAQKISSQNAMAMRYMQMQRQHTRV